MFAAATALGVARLGYFIPVRHVGGSQPGYPALGPALRAAEPAMRAHLGAIERHREALLAIDRAGRPATAPAPRFDQDWFARLDAAALYAMVRERAPRHIVEIGSGHSTRFMARAVADGALDTRILAVDPKPRAALAGLAVDHLARPFQAVTPEELPPLGPGDILFVDSSHVAQPGSDVDRIFAGLLPGLPGGVLVHVHDVFLPDAYPARWRWRGYNEQALVACLIGAGYAVLWSSHWIVTRRDDWLDGSVIGELPLVAGTPETSLWLEKL